MIRTEPFDPDSRGAPLPYGLMALSQMINCSVQALCRLHSQLTLDILARAKRIDDEKLGRVKIDDADCERIRTCLKVAEKVANDFEWQHLHDRIEIFGRYVRNGISHRDALVELRVLRETIDKGLNNQLVYRYPNDKAAVLSAWKRDWASVIAQFPSAQPDIFAAVDCWALGHSTASVFHLMRVLEHGLRAIATDVGKTFDVQNWQNIINEIKAEIARQGKTLPRGVQKNERLQFLSEAGKEFSYFKDGWRNYVSHGRSSYDEHQARSVLEHVKTFMNVLSSKMGEAGASSARAPSTSP